MSPEKALEAALLIVGGPSAMAREISTAGKPITSQAIGAWKTCPARWADAVYAAMRRAQTKPAPTREQLCPTSQDSDAVSHPAPVLKPERGKPRRRI